MTLWKLVSKIAFTLVMLWLWSGSVRFLFYAAQGPDVRFQLDSNHRLEGWPGFLMQYHKDGSCELVQWQDKDGELHSAAGINKFAILERYIVVKLDEGWLAIDRKTLKVWVPCPTLADLENAIGTKFGNIIFIEDPPESLRIIIWPWTMWAVTTLIFTGILIGGLWLLSVLFRRSAKQSL
jgi:hypothetical protein